MRMVALVVCLGACGRVGFDSARVSTDDAASDTRSDTASGATTHFLISGNGTDPTQLFTVDIATGQLVMLGMIDASFGTLTGLAYWDANTMYANSASDFVRITLSPFGVVAMTAPAGDFAALEREGDRLLAVAQNTNRLVSFVPGDSTATPMPSTLPVLASGGDLTRTSDGTWYWWTNTTKELYTLDITTGVATSIGGSTSSPFMTGLVATDDDELQVVGARLYGVDKATGLIDAGTPVCLVCPTQFTLQSGDTSRTP